MKDVPARYSSVAAAVFPGPVSTAMYLFINASSYLGPTSARRRHRHRRCHLPPPAC